MATIVKSWSLMAFAREFGKQMQVGTFEHNGEQFKSCIFTNASGDRRFVGFSSNLGELTPREIAADKDNLQVVLLDSDNYYLCRQGGNAWESVDLGF